MHLKCTNLKHFRQDKLTPVTSASFLFEEIRYGYTYGSVFNAAGAIVTII